MKIWSELCVCVCTYISIYSGVDVRYICRCPGCGQLTAIPSTLGGKSISTTTDSSSSPQGNPYVVSRKSIFLLSISPFKSYFCLLLFISVFPHFQPVVFVSCGCFHEQINCFLSPVSCLFRLSGCLFRLSEALNIMSAAGSFRLTASLFPLLAALIPMSAVSFLLSAVSPFRCTQHHVSWFLSPVSSSLSPSAALNLISAVYFRLSSFQLLLML